MTDAAPDTSACPSVRVCCPQLYLRLQSVGSVGHGCLIGLRAQVGGSGARSGEVSREDGLNERSEDNLGTTKQILS